MVVSVQIFFINIGIFSPSIRLKQRTELEPEVFPDCGFMGDLTLLGSLCVCVCMSFLADFWRLCVLLAWLSS